MRNARACVYANTERDVAYIHQMQWEMAHRSVCVCVCNRRRRQWQRQRKGRRWR